MATPTNEPPKDFADIIAEISHGQLHQRLTQEVAAIVAAVAETGNDGKLTLTLNITHEGTMVQVAGKVKAEIPKHAIPGSLFFHQDGQLFRDDPRQLPLRHVAKPTSVPADPDNVRSLPPRAATGTRRAGATEVIPQRDPPAAEPEDDPGAPGVHGADDDSGTRPPTAG